MIAATMTLPMNGGYGEPRFITAGWLEDGSWWSGPRAMGRRIISMRYGHADEEAYWREQMG